MLTISVSCLDEEFSIHSVEYCETTQVRALPSTQNV